MKETLKKVMKRAWEIKKQNVKNIFSICLKMAWAEIKKVYKKSKKTSFNDFRFGGLNKRRASNQYWTMNRVSEDESKIVVKVADEHLLETRYGYALILDRNHVVFVKDWQVSKNYFGNEVVLTKEYFNVKEWGTFNDFCENEEVLSWKHWLEIAKNQIVDVKWAK